MISLQKSPDRDFILLNLSDPQLSDTEWHPDHNNWKILTHTVRTVTERVHPDLITVSGDLAWAGQIHAYTCLADFLDSLQIPWAPVWGNHDNQDGPDMVNTIADICLAHQYCIFEKGDPSLGNGNYVISITENGRPVEGIIMMDTHDHASYTAPDGRETNEWAKLLPEQVEWYRDQVRTLKEMGCSDTALITHIPIYAYRKAFAAAFRADMDSKTVTPEESSTGICWNEGYKDAFGVLYEGICSYPADEGAFAAILEMGSTKHILAGHDHINNFVIPYKGVKFIYGLKAGPGCYWNPALNGGTCFRITADGIRQVWHEYVDVQDML